jgi:cation diffusion facilitator CzcD-associated flavoprotein CzcO
VITDTPVVVVMVRVSFIDSSSNTNEAIPVWSMLYSYSFEQNPDWTRVYPGQEEILDYLRSVALKYQLYRYIRFNTSVEAATWDDSTSRWKVDVKVTGAKDAEYSPEYTIECDFLVSAVGQLNQPQYPNIEGLDSFEGKVMHSARWDWSYNTEGKKIGIIGNGESPFYLPPVPFLQHTK